MSIRPFYGVRVLGLAPDRRSVRFRIFVVDYDIELRRHAELPDDAGFFLQLLWESADEDGGPIRGLFTWRELDDDGWLVVNSRWFVEGVERLAVRNHPPSEEDWAHLGTLQRGMHERDDGWPDEDRLVWADYAVRVTDPRWLEHLRPGRSWETGWYPDPTRRLRAEDAPYVPDLTNPEAVLTPFTSDGVATLAFSDDGRFLAVTSEEGELVVQDVDGWSERLRVSPDSAGRDIMWLPGRHVVTLKEDEYDELRPWAYDLNTGTEIDLPVEPGRVRSRTGRFRVEHGRGGRVDFVTGRPDPDRTVRLGDESSGRVTDVSFSADETRMFVAFDSKVHVLEPATGRVVDAFAVPAHWLGALAASPDGAYLAVAAEDWDNEWKSNPEIWRVADRELIMRRPSKDRSQAGTMATALAWSPDGAWLAAVVEHHEIHLFRVGLPDEPPAGVQLPAPVDEATMSARERGRQGEAPQRVRVRRRRPDAPPVPSGRPDDGESTPAVARALESYRSGDLSQARAVLRPLAGAGRTAVAGHAARALAGIELAAGERDVARELLRQIATGEDPAAGPHAAVALAVLERSGPESPLTRGLAAELTGQPETAGEIYASADVEHGLAGVLLGRLLAEGPTPQDAWDALTRALESTDPLAVSYGGHLLGALLWEDGDLDQAEAVLRHASTAGRATRDHPSGLLPWIGVRLGELRAGRDGDLERVREAFKLAQPLWEIGHPALADVGLYLLAGNPFAMRAALDRLRTWGDERHRHARRLCARLGSRILGGTLGSSGHPLIELLAEPGDDPESAAYALWLRGVRHHADGERAEAMRAWEESAAIGVLPFARWSGTCRGVLLTLDGDESAARDALRHGRDDRLVVEIAKGLSGDDADGAVGLYTMAAGGDDPIAAGRASLELGVVHFGQGDFAEAARCYERALDLCAGQEATKAAFNLAVARSRLGDGEGAIEAARIAHRRAVENGDPAYGRATTAERLGDMLRDQEDWAGARVAYADAVEAFKVHSAQDFPWEARWAILYLGQIQATLGEEDAARRNLLRLVKVHATAKDEQGREITTIAALRLGVMAKDHRDLSEATSWFERVIGSGFPDRHRAWAVAHLAELHHWLGDSTEAARHYGRTLEMTEEAVLVAEAAFRLGAHLAENGDPDQAMELMETAVATGDPDFAPQATELLTRLRETT